MTIPKPKIIKAERYIGGLSKIKKVDNPIKLSANESALGPSPKAIKALEKDKEKIFAYPQSDSDVLRDAISKKFNIDPDRIICGAGSDQIFDFACKLFLELGDEVIVTEFGFIMHRIYAALHGAKVLFAKEKNFKASVDEILNKVTDKTKIVFLANPNNPTGTYLSKNEMINLRKKLRSNILLIIDDAYYEFVDKDDFISGLDLFKDKPNVLITRTFSKIYGLAGLRSGWGYSSKEIIDAMYQIKPSLANLLKTSSEFFLVLSKFIKKKFAVGLFATIFTSSKIENIFFAHNVLCSIALFVHSLSLMASVLAVSAALLTLNGGLI